MAIRLNIFAAGPGNLSEFVSTLERLLGISFERKTDAYDDWFQFADAEVEVTVGHHDFINDGSLDFERYPFKVAVHAWSRDTEELREARRSEWARRILDALKTTRQFDLMLVEGVSRLVDRFSAQGEKEQR